MADGDLVHVMTSSWWTRCGAYLPNRRGWRLEGSGRKATCPECIRRQVEEAEFAADDARQGSGILKED